MKISIYIIFLMLFLFITGCTNDSSEDIILIRSNTSISVNYTTINNFTTITINNFTTVNNFTNNYYLSSATGAGVATAMARWVNTTHLNASSLMFDNGQGIGIGDNTPVESGAKLIIATPGGGVPRNATYFRNTGVNFGDEIRMLYSPVSYSVNNPAYIRVYFGAGTGLDTAFGFVTTNSSGALKQLLTINGAYDNVMVGTETLTADTIITQLYVQNYKNKQQAFKVVDSIGSNLFTVNGTGSIKLASTAKMAIGTTLDPNTEQLLIRGGNGGTFWNATTFKHNGPNYGQSVDLRLEPINNLGSPASIIRAQDIGNGQATTLEFYAQNNTGASLASIYMEGTTGNIGIGDVTAPDGFVKIQNNYNYVNALRVTNSADALLFNVDATGNTTVGTTLYVKNNLGRVGIGETTPGATLSVSGGATIGSGIDTATPPTNGLIVQGLLNATGTIQASGYISNDGTAGFTGTCTLLGLTSITVKNGLITGCS